MTESTHKTESMEEEVCCQHPKKQNMLAGSILIGAILIAGSIFYNTKIVLTKLDSAGFGSKGNGVLALQNNAPSAPSAPSQQPAADAGPVTIPAREGAAVIGKSSAKVTLVEFSDFQCPFCAKFYSDAYKVIKEKYINTGKLKVIFRNYPLPFHQNAQKAAEAAECANRQGKFEQYHDMLFTKGQSDGTGLAVDDLKKYADTLGLNKGTLGVGKNKFNTCLDKGEAADAIKKDMADAATVGVTGTPTMFVDGKRIVGAQPASVFEQAIEEALKK